MSTTTLLLVGGAALAALLLVVVLTITIRHGVRTRHELTVELAATQATVERLEQQVEDLEKSLRRLRAAARSGGQQPDDGYVVTDAGVVRLGGPTDVDATAGPARPVSDRLVLSATLGEPLVKAAAFGHGVRQALSAESRNRIRFAMRQEVRRARKQRRRDMKAAYRAMQMQGQVPGRVPGQVQREAS